MLPHATDIFSRSATLIKESSWNGSIQEKLQGQELLGFLSQPANDQTARLPHQNLQIVCAWCRVSRILAAFFLPDVIYVSAAGSMLCQIVNSLLLLPVSVARPLLIHLLDLLPPLDRLNRLLPAASPLEDQELQWPLHGEQAATQRAQTGAC